MVILLRKSNSINTCNNKNNYNNTYRRHHTHHKTIINTFTHHPLFFPRLSSTRLLSTMATKTEFLVLLPDYDGVLAKRMEIRPRHISDLKETAGKTGDILFGGPTLSEPFYGKEGETLQINGSAFLILSESKEAVLEHLEEDVYAKGGVWDMSKVQIMPMKSLYRKGT